jgi:hypothetical protein
LLKHLIPPVYDSSDAIYIALDENYNTWSGGAFKVDPAFFDWINFIFIRIISTIPGYLPWRMR